MWRVVRFLSCFSNFILFSMSDWHDVNLNLYLSYFFDLSVFLCKHLKPESAHILLDKFQLDVWMLFVNNIFVVLLVESERCFGKGNIFEKLTVVDAILSNEIIAGEEISIIELDGKLGDLLWVLDSIDKPVLEIWLTSRASEMSISLLDVFLCVKVTSEVSVSASLSINAWYFQAATNDHSYF